MTDLVLTSRPTSARVDRSTSRALDNIRGGQQVATARQLAKVEVIAETTEAALIAASHISVIESLLADRVPAAEGQLHAIARAGTAGLADVVLRASREVQ